MVKTTPLLAATAVLGILVSGLAAASPPQAATPISPGPQRPKVELWVTLDDTAKTLTGREELVWVNPTRDVPDMLLSLGAFKRGQLSSGGRARSSSPRPRRKDGQ
jgi:hypothetical protein